MEYWCKQSQTFQWKWKMTDTAIKNVPVQIDENVPVSELGHGVLARSYTSEYKIKDIAIEKYRSGGNGITFKDVIERFPLKKAQAQRSLKHFHARGILFTAEDLISQGIDLVENKSPQQYFPTCIKADIIENLKKRKNVLVDPTEVTSSNAPLSNVLAQQLSQNILDLLTNLPFAPLCIHKLQLQLSVSSTAYDDFKLFFDKNKRNRFIHTERIGKAIHIPNVTYIIYPKGKIMVYIACSDKPFKVETDNDASSLFAFFGRVRDRLLYLLSDVREKIVPDIMEWHLIQCDVNRDIEIGDNCQITLPDIQLKYAYRVFRLYLKSLQGKAVYRAEESLKLNQILPEALDNVTRPYKSIENKVDKLSEQLNQFKDSFQKCNCNCNQCQDHSNCNGVC